MDVTDFWDRVKFLMRKKGLTETDVARACGLSRNTFTGWIYKGIWPTVIDGCYIARVLGVSVEYLAGGRKRRRSTPASQIDNVRLLLQRAEQKLDKIVI
jgi:transcriptional regulator with XRE-family HTH domain